jgi:excisionase family DNA binding protein
MITNQVDDEVYPARRNQCLRIVTVAEVLDISVSSVRRLIRKGKLSVVYIGSSLRVSEQSLETLLKSGTRRLRGRGTK